MINPHKFNIELPEILTTEAYKLYGFTITNTNSNTFTASDCYTVTTAFTESLDYEVPTTSANQANCDNVKCDVVNVKFESCDDGLTRTLQYAVSDLSGYTSGDTVSAPLIGGISATKDTLSSSVTGTCHNIGGKASTITSTQQTAETGTGWAANGTYYGEQTDCSDGDCGCKTNFTVTNNTISAFTLPYRRCTGESETVFIGAGNTVTINQCVNMNQLWKGLYDSGLNSTDITIGGTYSNC
jgi:hypothetical protein